jgi:hypothetical protein
VDHHGGACERVKRIGKQTDPSGGACRHVEAWTAMISLDLDLERLICYLARSVVLVQRRNRLRLHGGTDGTVGQRWVAVRGSVGKGAGILLGVPTTRRSPVGAPKNVIDVYWGPQEGGSDTMLKYI